MSKLFVVGIPRDMDSAELGDIFADYGQVQHTTVVTDIDTGIGKGYAFVTMADRVGADAAIAALDGGQIDERTISVRFAQQPVVQPAPQLKKPAGFKPKNQGFNNEKRKGKRPRLSR
ncbi:hypothetical protein EOD41_02795 [Mucilaginibacter limnophilus]|uniref:RRM domain-containing protein n=1 Tax=Mucilaginibacter limnophilus TaxID=1932778 RepID=A0A437MYY2_9SPHI|nr:hypothetical protein [Mucilaginibacter limnophilus]RVU02882.1 hypothetical protein EOD41_02795 [Mucilaginibacter limnophilus]